MSKVLFIAVLGAFAAFAQSNTNGGTATGGGTTPGAGGGGSPSLNPPVRTPTQPTQPMQGTSSPTVASPPRPIFLSGRVMMEGGMPVPANITIQRVCGSSVHAAAYTDSKGHFSFQWGQTNGVFMDASESSSGLRDLGSSSGFGSSQTGSRTNGDAFGNPLANCELQAYLVGYRSDTVRLFNHTASDNPDIGVIVLHRLGNVEGSSISATSLLAPKDAKKAYDKGLQLVLKSKNDDAAKEFEKAVAAYPKYADAWSSLGKVRVQQKSLDAAREAYLKAVEADPKLVYPYIALGMMSADKSQWAETNQYLAQATKLDPVDYPHAWYVSAVANYNLKKFDDAEKSAREAMKLDPKHQNPRADYLLGLILVEKHDYAGAATQLKSYLDHSPNATDQTLVQTQLKQIQTFLATNEASR